MAEARPFTARISEGTWTVAQRAAAAAGRPGVDRSTLARAGLLLLAAVPADVLADVIDQADRPRGWAGKAADDAR
jgi:hypothetical protein